MRISEAATICGLSADTIRYYEKLGMLPEIDRDDVGHRSFSKIILEWLTLLYWLRETGMSIKQMRLFAELAKSGPETISERRKILMGHSELLKERHFVLDRCEAVLAVKIASYERPDTGTGR